MWIGGCLHIATETAVLARTLITGEAELVLCASNPLSAQDDGTAALVVDRDVPIFARCGEDRETYFHRIEAVIAHRPQTTVDDGADLISTIHAHHPALTAEIAGGTEETTTAVMRLRSMVRLKR